MILLDDRIAVLPIEDPPTTRGGLIIPDKAKQRIDQGVIIYRGPATREVRVGDHVFFSAYSGVKVSLEGEGVFIIMREPSVLFVYETGKPNFMAVAEINRLISEADSLERLSSLVNDYVFANGMEF